MHRVVSSGLLSEESAPGAGYFSLDAVLSKAIALPRTLWAAYHDEEVWEALWMATLQTYQGCESLRGKPQCGVGEPQPRAQPPVTRAPAPARGIGAARRDLCAWGSALARRQGLASGAHAVDVAAVC